MALGGYNLITKIVIYITLMAVTSCLLMVRYAIGDRLVRLRYSVRSRLLYNCLKQLFEYVTNLVRLVTVGLCFAGYTGASPRFSPALARL